MTLNISNLIKLNSENDFCISDCNKSTYDIILNTAFPNLLLVGKEKSGKSTLAGIWAEKNNAIMLKDFNFINSNVVIEDIEQYQKSNFESNILHILNLAKETGKKVFITSKLSSHELNFNLRDLASRINAISAIYINSPDEDLCKKLFLKLFSQRQLKVEKAIIDFLSKNTKRDYEQINFLVQKIDELALEQNQTITIPFVKKICSNLT